MPAAPCAALSPASSSKRTIAALPPAWPTVPLLQFICGLSEVDRVVVPSKSTLQRYFLWWSAAEVRSLVQKLLVQGAEAPEQLGLAEPLDLETAFLDSTCLCTNIHYPVDWVLRRRLGFLDRLAGSSTCWFHLAVGSEGATSILMTWLHYTMGASEKVEEEAIRKAVTGNQ